MQLPFSPQLTSVSDLVVVRKVELFLEKFVTYVSACMRALLHTCRMKALHKRAHDVHAQPRKQCIVKPLPHSFKSNGSNSN